MTAAAAAAALTMALLAPPAGAVSPAPPPTPDYFASQQSGDALWRSCGASLGVRAPDPCWAYVAGVADAARLTPGPTVSHSCAPADVRANELADVVRRFLADHPQSRSAPAARVVSVALAQAYPCPEARAR